ncbi:hypothetical protein E1293_00560 [Actinomadura darangshiensis]|uniref:Uncharacterized protein n=1 Tax=Actinomadura darangshiensis TaxID=705336 RepID=A0A4R5C7P8_9ACTN|nr:hypothetical protein [Actinomadura darangshiensis]TDD92992.1 hypothetical protein E1293_00560 [Actinomadura darangshiensis]
MNRASVLLAASAAALALTAAGCGGSGESGGAGGSTSGSSGAKAAATADPGVKHAQCMRENGLPGYPDPGQNPQNLPGRDSPQFQKAQRACQSLEPAEKQPGTPENAELQQKMLKWTQCMRKNGVPNFPDPQNGRIQVKKGTIDNKSPQFRKAVEACRPLEVGGAKGTGG